MDWKGWICFLFSEPCILAIYQKGCSAGRSLLHSLLDNYEVLFLLTATVTGLEMFKKLQPALSPPPQIQECQSSYTAPPGCFYQAQNFGAGTQGYEPDDEGTEDFFASCSHYE